MVDIFTVSPAAFQSPASSVDGRSITNAQWGPRKRAYLAAQWKAGTLNVKPTVKLAAQVFGVCEALVRQATVEVQRKAEALNGVPVMPPNPIESLWWTELSQAEQDDFVRTHFDSVWASVERLTG